VSRVLCVFHPVAHALRNGEDLSDPEIAEVNTDRYLTCIDGFYASNKIHRLPSDEAEELCAEFNVPEATNLCRRIAARSENSIVEGEEDFRWNYALLEKYAPSDNTATVSPGTFPPRPPQQQRQQQQGGRPQQNYRAQGRRHPM